MRGAVGDESAHLGATKVRRGGGQGRMEGKGREKDGRASVSRAMGIQAAYQSKIGAQCR